jgi:lipopolysaccharide biosynthesis glycosyltransferase
VVKNNQNELMKNINIIFSSDNNYSQHLGVALCSIFENKSKKNNYILNVYVIDGGISKENRLKLRRIEKKYIFKIKYIKINIQKYTDLYISGHITQSAYYRILIPDLVDKEIKKILYLDCDLIILKDLLELYEININEYLLAAIEENVLYVKEKLNIDESKPYFNSGVLLINICNWRKFNISKKTITFIRQNPEKITLWDQDALNYILQDKWLVLDRKYNFLSSEIDRLNKNNENVDISPIIVHYSSSIKPWKFNGKHIFNDLYFYYLNKTPLNKKIYNIKILRKISIRINIIKRFIIKVLITLKRKIKK